MRWLIGLAMLFMASTASAQNALLPVPGSDVKIGLYTPSSAKADMLLPWVSNYPQPDEYAQWWKSVKACANVGPSDVSHFKFYEVNTKTWFGLLDSAGVVYAFRNGDIMRFIGLTVQADQSIFVPVNRVYDSSTVMHEMLHAVLKQAGRKHGHGEAGVTEAFDRCKLAETATEKDLEYH